MDHLTEEEWAELRERPAKDVTRLVMGLVATAMISPTLTSALKSAALLFWHWISPWMPADRIRSLL